MIAGADPFALRWSMRQLVAAADTKQRTQWDHTALICCKLHNLLKSPRDRALSFEDFHPMRKRPKRYKTAATVEAEAAALKRAGRCEVIVVRPENVVEA